MLRYVRASHAHLMCPCYTALSNARQQCFQTEFVNSFYGSLQSPGLGCSSGMGVKGGPGYRSGAGHPGGWGGRGCKS